MTGIILCGGLSHPDAKHWALTAMDKMRSIAIPVKVSVDREQYADYVKLFSEDQLIQDNASLALSLGGPLLGVLSAYLACPTEDIFAMGCDMPLMETALLQELFTLYQNNPLADAYVFTTNGEPEPLCGIYRAKGLSVIPSMIQNGELIKHSMKFMLDHLKVETIAVREEQKKCFLNFNAHAALNGL